MHKESYYFDDAPPSPTPPKKTSEHFKSFE